MEFQETRGAPGGTVLAMLRAGLYLPEAGLNLLSGWNQAAPGCGGFVSKQAVVTGTSQ